MKYKLVARTIDKDISRIKFEDITNAGSPVIYNTKEEANRDAITRNTINPEYVIYVEQID